MIYLDTSVALAQLLGEARTHPDEIWNEVLVSSRLLEYELFTRLHARGLTRSHASIARELLDRVALADLSATVLAARSTRALSRFPRSTRCTSPRLTICDDTDSRCALRHTTGA